MHRLLATIAVVIALALTGALTVVQAGEPPRSEFFTTSDGVKIHYLTLGSRGSWVVLIHGYTDNAERMWVKTGIAHSLAKNHRIVALDNRNHGLSDKPEPYGFGRAEDVIELMNHLSIDKAHIHGYSMGGSITARLMSRYPERFITATFGGSGISETDDAMRSAAAALDPPMPEPQGEAAESFKTLREASAARTAAAARAAPGKAPAPRPPLEIDLKSIAFPVLAINGEYDRPYSKTHRMWRELRQFQSVIVPKKNHMSMIMIGGPMPPEYIQALKKFIDANDVR